MKPNVGERVRGVQKSYFLQDKDYFGAVCPALKSEMTNSFAFLSGVYFSMRDWGDIQKITVSPSQTLQSSEDTPIKNWFTIPESSLFTKKRKGELTRW